jgi:hypothetical protein
MGRDANNDNRKCGGFCAASSRGGYSGHRFGIPRFPAGDYSPEFHKKGEFRITPDGKHIAIIERNCMHLFETATGQYVRMWFLRDKSVYTDLAVSPDGTHLAVTRQIPMPIDG